MSSASASKPDLKSPIKKLLKIGLKVISWVLLVIIALILIIHVPFVQRSISHRAANYLQEKVGGVVELDAIYFSVLGNVYIRKLNVCDPDQTCFLDLSELSVSVSLPHLLEGQLVVDELLISDFNGTLEESENGLNIDYIIDALSSPEPTSSAAAGDGSFSVRVDQLILHDISFTYAAEGDLEVKPFVGDFAARDVSFSLNPNKIMVGSLELTEGGCDLMIQPAVSSSPPILSGNRSARLPPFDFNSGFQIEVGSLNLSDNSFSLHFGEEKAANAFDPDHLIIDSINLSLKGVEMFEDSLNVALSDLSATFPGLAIADLKAEISADMNEVAIKNFGLKTERTQFDFAIEATYNNWVTMFEDKGLLSAALDLKGHVHPEDVIWLNDSIGSVFKGLGSKSQLKIAAYATKDQLQIRDLNLQLGNNRVNAAGEVKDYQDFTQISWQDLSIQASTDKKFKSVIQRWTDDFIPQRLTMDFVSTGRFSNASLAGGLSSDLGALEMDGTVGYDQRKLTFDMMLEGNELRPDKVLESELIGPVNLQITTKGVVDSNPQVELNGRVTRLFFNGQEVKDIEIEAQLKDEALTTSIVSMDPIFHLDVLNQVKLRDSIQVALMGSFTRVDVGTLFNRGRSINLSGKVDSKVSMNGPNFTGQADLYNLQLGDTATNYQLDTLRFFVALRDSSSDFSVASDDFVADFDANFSINQLDNLVSFYTTKHREFADEQVEYIKENAFQLDAWLIDPEPLELLGIDIQQLSAIHLNGELAEGSNDLNINLSTKDLSLYDFTVDSLLLDFQSNREQLSLAAGINTLWYDTTQIGQVRLDFAGFDNLINGSIEVERDSLIITKMVGEIANVEDVLFITLDTLITFNQPYEITQRSPIKVWNGVMETEPISVKNDQIELRLISDSAQIELDIIDADFAALNQLFYKDSIVHLTGFLNVDAMYHRTNNLIDLKMKLDCLRLDNSKPLSLIAIARTEEDGIPFRMEAKGIESSVLSEGIIYDTAGLIDATVNVDIEDLKAYRPITSQYLDQLEGQIMGNIKVTGALGSPTLNGALDVYNIHLRNKKPRLNFRIDQEKIGFDNNGVFFNDFTIYDNKKNPLVLDGYLRTEDYSDFEYDFKVTSDRYLLINNPPTEDYELQGILALGSDLEFSGDQQNTDIAGSLVIRDTTNLVIVLTPDETGIKSDEGVVVFMDPTTSDTLAIESLSTYDSIIASLPSFNLNTTVGIEKNANFKIIVDNQSGDFIESKGNADINIILDRTGNVSMSGSYVIEQGLYRLSFYDIVQKDFKLTKGSSILWNDIPAAGSLDIKAVYTIKTSSLGLMGNEIGENEKNTYRRALPYDVTINIEGTIETPIISFSLDLPQEEKNNFPALANKLNRLNQPEFESELNKQVFGLLVLGGFLPESSGSDINQGVFVNTAISNSVNSILSNQLNQFAESLVKGVDIDVGLQSYSDFSTGTGGGQTRTAMDFRVSKQLMNDRISIEAGGSFDISNEQSGVNRGSNYRGDVAIIYDLTREGKASNRMLKLFNNQTYDIIYHDVRNTGISFIVIRDLDKK